MNQVLSRLDRRIVQRGLLLVFMSLAGAANVGCVLLPALVTTTNAGEKFSVNGRHQGDELLVLSWHEYVFDGINGGPHAWRVRVMEPTRAGKYRIPAETFWTMNVYDLNPWGFAAHSSGSAFACAWDGAGYFAVGLPARTATEPRHHLSHFATDLLEIEPGGTRYGIVNLQHAEPPNASSRAGDTAMQRLLETAAHRCFERHPLIKPNDAAKIAQFVQRNAGSFSRQTHSLVDDLLERAASSD